MNTTTQPGPLEVRLSDQLGPERAKWYARGQDWALTSALSDPWPEWMSDDIANAYADGAMAGVAEERKRIRAALMDMHARTSDHNYYHCAAVELFGA